MAQLKKQRQFWMQIEGANNTYTIQSPLTLELDVERAIFSSMQTGTFTIYNLAESTRKDLYLDWNNYFDAARKITVRAGYLSWGPQVGPTSPTSYPIIFSGELQKCYSTRDGPSWTTTIQAWDAGWFIGNSDASIPFNKNQDFLQRVTALAQQIEGVTVGYIDPSIQNSSYISRGAVFAGSPWDILTQLAAAAKFDLFIDLGILYMVPHGMPVANLTTALDTIDSKDGLLNTPIRQQFSISWDMIFEPRLRLGQSLTLNSIETVNNGSYTVVGIKHTGIISDAVGGDLITTPTVWYGQAVGVIEEE